MNNPDIDWVPEKWEESVNSVLDNAYTYGRSAISDGVRLIFCLFFFVHTNTRFSQLLDDLPNLDPRSCERFRTGESGADGEKGSRTLGSPLPSVDDVEYRSNSRGTHCRYYVCIFRLGKSQGKLRHTFP